MRCMRSPIGKPRGQRRRIVLVVARVGDAALDVDLEAGEIGVEHEVHDAAHGIRAIGRRGAAGHDFHALDQRIGQQIDVERAAPSWTARRAVRRAAPACGSGPRRADSGCWRRKRRSSRRRVRPPGTELLMNCGSCVTAAPSVVGASVSRSSMESEVTGVGVVMPLRWMREPVT